MSTIVRIATDTQPFCELADTLRQAADIIERYDLRVLGLYYENNGRVKVAVSELPDGTPCVVYDNRSRWWYPNEDESLAFFMTVPGTRQPVREVYSPEDVR